MSREVRRVPLDFDFPLDKTWSGYLMPDSLASTRCPDCNGSGQTHFGWWLQNFSVNMSRMIDDARLQEQGRPLHPRLAASNAVHGHWNYPVKDDPRSGSGTFVPDRPGPQAVEFFNRLRRKPCESDMYLVYRRLLEITGMSVECRTCSGSGGFEAYSGQNADREAWTRTEPPTGEGWQLWQTVSEGGPVSPVFRSAEELALWMKKNGEARSFGTALNFVREGWAPSGMSIDGEYRTGVDAVGDPEFPKETP